MREPSERGAHWRLGYLRFAPVGLNLVARTGFEYPTPIIVPVLHVGQVFAILLLISFFMIS